jgi:23S rRNA pseudouridine2605 synthase
MNATKADSAPKGERVAKIIARAGLCSRREAERWIADGRVVVDGKKIASPALNIADPGRVLVDGQPLPGATAPRLWRYHKPPGVLTTAHDPQGRPTVSDKMPPNMPRVMPIGRLDMPSEGLLLMTNDGALKRHLELPATGWTRRYRVRVYGRIDAGDLAGLAPGVTVEGVKYGPIEAKLERQDGVNGWVAIALKEGKNREVRKVMAHLGLTVNRLIRISFGPFQLGGLDRGVVEEMPPRVLRQQLGKATAAKLGLLENARHRR